MLLAAVVFTAGSWCMEVCVCVCVCVCVRIVFLANSCISDMFGKHLEGTIATKTKPKKSVPVCVCACVFELYFSHLWRTAGRLCRYEKQNKKMCVSVCARALACVRAFVRA